MNWRQGLLRFWVLGSLGWMAIWFIMVNMVCLRHPDGRMQCDTMSSHWIAEWIDRMTWSYLKIAAVGFVPPALVLMIGAIAVWTTSRRG